MINTNHNLSSWLCPSKYCITLANWLWLCQSDYLVIANHSLSVRFRDRLKYIHLHYFDISDKGESNVVLLKIVSECYCNVSDYQKMSKISYNDCLKNGTYVGTFVTGNEQNILFVAFQL